MALFRKNKKEQTIAELESYYANNKSTSSLRAWIMAFLSLLVTILVLTGVFLGGRWVYRSVTDKNDSSSVSTGSVEDQTNESTTNGSNTLGQGSTGDDSTTQTGTVTDQAASTTRPVNNRPSNGKAIPNTGAGEVALFLPVIALAVGYIVARKRQLK